MRYLPFLSGTYTTAAGLSATDKALGDDQHIFQIDENYARYRGTKKACRAENIHKYFLQHDASRATMVAVNQYIVSQLTLEHSSIFSILTTEKSIQLTNNLTGETIRWGNDWIDAEGEYVSLFDALCSQVQEDLAVFQMDDQEKDWLSAAHICFPNYWAPEDKVGKPFSAVHQPVPHMDKMMPHAAKMLGAIITHKGPFTRFAWGISTDDRLNHHPRPPAGYDSATWHGRKVNPQDATLFVRSERQNLVGFREENAFLFTIRTFFYPLHSLDATEKSALVQAVNSMSHETLVYKGLTEIKSFLNGGLISE